MSHLSLMKISHLCDDYFPPLIDGNVPALIDGNVPPLINDNIPSLINVNIPTLIKDMTMSQLTSTTIIHDVLSKHSDNSYQHVCPIYIHVS